MPYSHSIDDIVEIIQDVKQRKKGCCLLIGAGCSASAGIPTAKGFVDIIKDRYNASYKRANSENYPECMGKLSTDQRRDLIAEFVDTAKINWAHIGIALLIKNGYVNRVLTTNFDPLIIRACSLLGVFPAVYDAAASQIFKAAFIPEKSVFFLHGQHTGFLLMHTTEECNKQAATIKPVFDHTGTGCTWIVVGYSGDCDPVFERLASFPQFDNRLYWIGYKDNEPSEHVRNKLLETDKDAHYIKNFDADSFFIELTQKLGIFPPDLATKPFTHLDSLLNSLMPYYLKQDLDIISVGDVLSSARNMIRQAISTIEQSSNLPDLTELLMQCNWDQIIDKYDQQYELSNKEREILSWAFLMQGEVLLDQALNKTGQEADALFEQAYGKYAAALRTKPDMHEALYNWGVALAHQSGTKTGQDANALSNQACEKYAAALRIKPDMHEALYNWGTALTDQAKTKTRQEADTLFNQAYEKYAAALRIKPDTDDVLYDWGNALKNQAKTKTRQEADALFEQAYEKYTAALCIKPNKYEALIIWGNALTDQALTKTWQEADALFEQAYEKYTAALRIKPDMHDVLYNWGVALAEQAKTKTRQEADTLFNQAYEKCAAALRIKPMHDVLYVWGTALLDQAKTKTGEDADVLFEQAYEKYAAALRIKPDIHEALYNWGIALMDQAKTKTGEDADILFEQAYEKYAAALRINPDMDDVLFNWGIALLSQALTKTGQEVDALFEQAYKKYAAACRIKPMHDVLYVWGSALIDQAKTKTGEDADVLFEQAYEKYAAALRIKPDMHEALYNWGIALMDQAKTKTGQDSDVLFEQAYEKWIALERLNPGSIAYNLACICALTSKTHECQKWLLVSKQCNTLPDHNHLLNDTDLDNVRDSEWFKQILDEV